MTRLSVNIDHFATLRQARGGTDPDPVFAARLAELAGADGITCHLRGDRRHIQDRDLTRLKENISTPLNVEMAASAEMVRIALAAKPALVTFVPERRREITTTGGIDAARLVPVLRRQSRRLMRARIGVSLFVDPDPRQIEAAAEIGVKTIELNTNAYSSARTARAQARAYDALVVEASHADALGLRVAAGHGLTLRNVAPVAAIPEILELNIGHSIVAHAALVGIERAVREMLEQIGR